MHHLARHSVACFLTRGDLYLSWEEGQAVFEELLLDAVRVGGGGRLFLAGGAAGRLLEPPCAPPPHPPTNTPCQHPLTPPSQHPCPTPHANTPVMPLQTPSKPPATTPSPPAPRTTSSTPPTGSGCPPLPSSTSTTACTAQSRLARSTTPRAPSSGGSCRRWGRKRGEGGRRREGWCRGGAGACGARGRTKSAFTETDLDS